MKHLMLAALLALLPLTAYAGPVTIGDIQRLNLSQITLDGTVVTATGAELNTLSGITATTAELNSVAKNSTRLVTISAGSTTATCAANGTGKINLINAATNATVTMPAATGSGCVYLFEWATLPAQAGQTGDVIQASGASQEFRGVLSTLSDDSAGMKGWAMAGGADNDKLTFTSSTKYVATKGAWVAFKDVATGVYDATGIGSSTGTEATPAATGQR